MTTPAHMNAAAAEAGDTVTYRAVSDYDFQVLKANQFLTNGSKYTIAEVWTTFGDPQVSVSEVPHRFFNALLFADFTALFGVTAAAVTAGGTGGTNGTGLALVIPAPPTGGVQAVGTFTVAGGIVTAIQITTAGKGYPHTNISLTNTAFVGASTGLTGATATLTVAQVN